MRACACASPMAVSIQTPAMSHLPVHKFWWLPSRSLRTSSGQQASVGGTTVLFSQIQSVLATLASLWLNVPGSLSTPGPLYMLSVCYSSLTFPMTGFWEILFTNTTPNTHTHTHTQLVKKKSGERYTRGFGGRKGMEIRCNCVIISKI